MTVNLSTLNDLLSIIAIVVAVYKLVQIESNIKSSIDKVNNKIENFVNISNEKEKSLEFRLNGIEKEIADINNVLKNFHLMRRSDD